MAQALRLTALGMRSRRQLCVSNCEAYELVVLPWIPVLACAKFAERGEFGNVDIVVHECVWLLHDDNIGIWAREAPEYHGRCPEGTAVIDFERQALFVAPQVLKTVGEEISTLPVAKADDVSHVTAAAFATHAITTASISAVPSGRRRRWRRWRRRRRGR